jgi:hypothetical protein
LQVAMPASGEAGAGPVIHIQFLPYDPPKVRDRALARKVPGWMRQPSAPVLAACLATLAAGRSNAITGNATACLGQLDAGAASFPAAADACLHGGTLWVIATDRSRLRSP